MGANIHRILSAVGAICAGFVPILTADDATGVGIDPSVGRIIGLIGAMVVVVATVFRAYWPSETA